MQAYQLAGGKTVFFKSYFDFALLQCFDTVCWATRKASGPVKTSSSKPVGTGMMYSPKYHMSMKSFSLTCEE